jgi:Skp family chaperone for outer membrane proteins
MDNMDSTKRASAAKALLADPVFQEAVQEYSKQLVQEWEQCTKKERREELWAHQAALKAVVNNLAGFVQSRDYELKTAEKKGMFR